jgi:hypothetical protein
MPDKDVELSHLALADRHIAEGIARIVKQETLIDRLQSSGHELATAHRLLRALQGGMIGMQQHRALIVQALAASPPLRSAAYERSVDAVGS